MRRTWTLRVGRPGPGMWTDDVVMEDTDEMAAYQVAERWANAMGVEVAVHAGRKTLGMPTYQFWPGRWRAHEMSLTAEGEGRMPMHVRGNLRRQFDNAAANG